MWLRGVLGLVVALGIVVPRVWEAHVREVTSVLPSGYCRPLLVDWSGSMRQCFLPSQVIEAESQLPFSPIDPVPAVRRVMSLALRQVIIIRHTPHGPVTNSVGGSKIVSIQYVFGHIPGDGDGVPVPTPPQPRFVLITEKVFDGQGRQGGRISRGVGEAGNRSGNVRKYFGPWEFSAYVPARQIHVDFTTNADKETTRLLGQAVLAKQ